MPSHPGETRTSLESETGGSEIELFFPISANSTSIKMYFFHKQELMTSHGWGRQNLFSLTRVIDKNGITI
jgi:hypothetical protein